MTAYGVASRAMYDYSEALTFDARSILRNIIYPTYYMMYGNVEEELAELDRRMKEKRTSRISFLFE